MYLANEVYVTQANKQIEYEKRRAFQQKALTRVKMLAYFATLALEHKAILMKEYTQIAKLTSDCQNLIGAWVSADK